MMIARMRSVRRLALAALVAVPPAAPALLRAQSPAPASASAQVVVDPSLAAIDSALAATYPAGGPGASVIVERGGRVLLRKAYGMADVELGVPLQPEHVLRIGSITKQFTAVAALMLVDEGKLSLDDDVTEFIPDYPTQGRRITVEHLLTHTSGIRSYTDIPEWRPTLRNDLSPTELISVFRGQPVDFAPGQDWRYNNSGYVLLGAIIEKISGQSYADFLRTRIFEPLGMRGTRVETQTAVIPGRVRGYATTDGRVLQNAMYMSSTHPYAAGAILSTTDDLLRWGHAVAEGRLLKPETWRRAHTAYALPGGRSSGYGYGWFVSTLAGQPTVEHGGDINGFSSHGMWMPSERLLVYVLSNAERDFANPETFSTRIAERVLGREFITPAIAVAPSALDAYTGVYRVGDADRRIVTRDGGRLYVQRGRGAKVELRPVARDQFVSVNTGARFTFVREGGRVTGVRLRPRIGPEDGVSPRTDERVEDAAAPPAAGSVVVPAAVLDAYAGRYQLTPELVLTIRRDGDVLKAQATGQREITLGAVTQTRFTAQDLNATIDFERDAAGAVTRLILNQNGRAGPAPRLP
ncbi:serine hydrolase [Longimicrobium terrae]|uniref:CubicO group peptidase (Beta-lactamase class C family) n=1 Tax=Longimicrobium terrae TaxID=1639882 RepID=A0A841GYQ3_9BACT|nr:serine hydrolase [Longimicrobium terrae]MBB4636594.1 CubicO group peptidase (beta-lactamase class C family) [Longimicrobium terrae]MBB6070882.1 CubicO group peptidase (beta-lactamase class C family) [Longimicrobium terrae]NNC28906.1 serine hydrolase [Longimicrobium terrae]